MLMFLEFIHYFQLGKSIAQTAIVDAVPSVFATVFAMISSDDTSLVLGGLLMLIGISSLLLLYSSVVREDPALLSLIEDKNIAQ